MNLKFSSIFSTAIILLSQILSSDSVTTSDIGGGSSRDELIRNSMKFLLKNYGNKLLLSRSLTASGKATTSSQVIEYNARNIILMTLLNSFLILGGLLGSLNRPELNLLPGNIRGGAGGGGHNPPYQPFKRIDLFRNKRFNRWPKRLAGKRPNDHQKEQQSPINLQQYDMLIADLLSSNGDHHKDHHLKQLHHQVHGHQSNDYGDELISKMLRKRFDDHESDDHGYHYKGHDLTADDHNDLNDQDNHRSSGVRWSNIDHRSSSSIDDSNDKCSLDVQCRGVDGRLYRPSLSSMTKKAIRLINNQLIDLNNSRLPPKELNHFQHQLLRLIEIEQRDHGLKCFWRPNC